MRRHKSTMKGKITSRHQECASSDHEPSDASRASSCQFSERAGCSKACTRKRAACVTIEGDDENLKRKQTNKKTSKPDTTSSSSVNKIKTNSKHVSGQLPSFTKLRPSQSTLQVNYTPLEQQYLALKKDHQDTILFIECGYKYRCFDKDSEIVSQELNMGSFPDHNFVSTSFPVHRLSVHLRRIVSKGHKVGLVKQIETTALKAAGDNRSRIFDRKLTAVYTKSTLLEDNIPQYDGDQNNVNEIVKEFSGYLICVYEVQKKTEKVIDVGILAVRPTTGDISYWCFVDDLQRGKLESILIQLQPVEILVPLLSLSALTEQLLKCVIESFCTLDDRIRLEKMDDSKFLFTNALAKLTEFYTSQENDSSDAYKTYILSLPPVIICCLGALLAYLQELCLEEILKNPCYIKEMFCTPDVMHLSASTIRSLELFSSTHSHTFSGDGSVLRIFDNTSTRFGSRLIRQWLVQPLTDARKIQCRQSIIAEILKPGTVVFSVMRKCLKNMPDLERLLCLALHLRICCQDFYVLVQRLSHVHEILKPLQVEIETNVLNSDMKSLLQDIITAIQSVLPLMENLNEGAFKAADKTNLFRDTSGSPDITQCRNDISDVLSRIESLRPSISSVLNQESFDYSCVSGHEYLIEVKNENNRLVPQEWIKISGTKQVSRYRSPEVEKLYCELCRLREMLQYLSHNFWLEYLRDFNQNFYTYKRAIQLLATLDCYFSLADFAKQDGYCRPEIQEGSENILLIKQGRHPVLERFLPNSQQYVANDTSLCDGKCCLIITGPNMGGKSSYMRQVALIVLLAHVGSHVPAESATLSLTDSIFVRMGAADELCRKRSTFMVEMEETSEILRTATPRSLVVLDELGRGTSTNDGTAIAFATLEQLVTKVKCKTLFVTHYLPILHLCQVYSEQVSSQHMGFIVHKVEENVPSIETLTFLYQLKDGAAERSYGMNVAKLAGIAASVVIRAIEKSNAMEAEAKRRKHLHDMTSIFQAGSEAAFDHIAEVHVDELK